ncbi:hypothetical protein SAY87_023118 [Trapa incisa]|uniref:C2 domain-containing protein n=1 Tax=Trapa incisa TaxID=236973 RepID=A0AAN7K5G2_9MYRT|nr:hypothetical protein SAY87_023118 [Trapa incisa]
MADMRAEEGAPQEERMEGTGNRAMEAFWSEIFHWIAGTEILLTEPRGFAFIEFVDSYDAADAQHRLNGEIFAGKRLSVVVAAETRKRPQEMHHRNRSGRPARNRGYHGRSRSRSLSRSPSPRATSGSRVRSPRATSGSRARSPRATSGSRARQHSRSYSPAPRRHKDYSVSPSERQRQELSTSPRGPARDNGGQEYKGGNSRWRSSRSPSGSRSREFELPNFPVQVSAYTDTSEEEEGNGCWDIGGFAFECKGSRQHRFPQYGKIDPYVVIKYKNQERKSSVAREQGGSPSWNEKFTFRAEYPGNSHQCKLTLTLMDKDTFSADDFLGEVTIHVEDLLAFGVEQGTAQMRPTKYRVVGSDNRYCGEIQVGVSFNLKVEEECRGLEIGGWKQSES